MGIRQKEKLNVNANPFREVQGWNLRLLQTFKTHSGGMGRGVSGTGVLARLHFHASDAGVADISWGDGAVLRDPDNIPVPLNSTLGATVTIQ